jgi:hypothetical protein
MAFDDGGERVEDLKMIGSKVGARAATDAACDTYMAAHNFGAFYAKQAK